MIGLQLMLHGVPTANKLPSISSQNEASIFERQTMMLAGMNFARRLVGTQMMKDWGMELTNRQLPECAKHGNYTQPYMECHLRHITLPGMAPVGTCRIGAASDPATVVDPLLRYVVTHAFLAFPSINLIFFC